TLAANEYATLNTLSEKLRDDVDILYLVAHGAVIDGEPRLYLQDEQGRVQVVSGNDLVTRIGELQNAPRLVVLASCQSANMTPRQGSGQAGDNGALASLGPRLAAAGVSAVIAMQGNISMNTVAQFMPVFFKELARDGQIDRAMAAARAAVRDNADAWMPVLFLRLKSGRIWYVPGFGGEKRSFEKFPALMDAIRGSRCTPILGSGISENLFGSRREIAAHWAEEYRFPLAPFAREDLPEVAQYLAVNQSPIFPREGLGKYLRQEIWRRYGSQLAPDLQNAELPKLIAGVGELKRKQDASDAHAVLAALPFPIFITTNPDNLLIEALKAAGKDPQVELCKWNEDMEFESIYKREPDYRPDEKRPLVYCLFGQFND
ncbi:MAG: CHAT domain-containing protein, partial [Anaerolineales bacterium]|nr:CHAT domain-containing protein [Anaerolineales bacterium]